MKQRWLAAVIVSAAFHLALFLGFRAVIRAVVPAAAPASAPLQVSGDEPRLVEIIRVGVQNRTAPAHAVAPAKSVSSPHGVRKPSTGQPAAEPGPREGEGESDVELAVEPGAAGGELRAEEPAAAKPSFAALIHERLARGAVRCYPAAAQRFRQRGEVMMAFCVSALGVPEEISLFATSGSSLLDEAAQNCVVPSAAPLPVEASGQCFRVPVRFGQ